ncbi:hypothetical protein FO519_001841 [Halicephalobus sp. NKZ332]|nr:hypothetical protein FO519_001841 [Halicephalobus sp. NKZ332]
MMLGKRITVIFAVLTVGLVLVNGEITREGDKITIRTKRQQCVCIMVSPTNNQLQCNCDNTQTPSTTSGSAQTTCGCVLIVIKVQGAPGTTSASGNTAQGSSIQHPQYQCQCSVTPQQPTSNTVPQQFNPFSTQQPIQATTVHPPIYSTPYTTTRPGSSPYITTPTYIPQQYNISEPSNNPCTCIQILVSNGATQYHCDCNGLQQDTINLPASGNNFLQDQATNTNFLSSALNQADYLGNNINSFQQPQQTQQLQQNQPTQQLQQPHQIQQLQQPITSAYTQSPLTSYQNTVASPIMQTPVVPQNYLNTALNQANYLNTAAAGIAPQQTQPIYNNPQQLSQSQYSNYQQDGSVSQFDSEPATTTCITISVPGSCMCGSNYVQCADNMCCHKRYRSQKSEESAMDIIVDVLKNIKDRLDRS